MATLPNGGRLKLRYGTLSDYNLIAKEENTLYLVEDVANNSYYIFIGENEITAKVTIDNEVYSDSDNAVSGKAVDTFIKGQVTSAIEVDYAGTAPPTNLADSLAVYGHFQFYDDGTVLFKYDKNKVPLKLQTAFDVGEGLSFVDDNGDGIYTLKLSGVDGFISVSSDIEQVINSDIKINGNLSVGTNKKLLVDTIDVLNESENNSAILTLNRKTIINGGLEVLGGINISNGGTLTVEGLTSLNSLTISGEATLNDVTLNGTLAHNGVFVAKQSNITNNEEATFALDPAAKLIFGSSGYYLSQNAVNLPETSTLGIAAAGSITATQSITSDSSLIAKLNLYATGAVIGSESGNHISIDSNTIQAYAENNVASPLQININGGLVTIGTGGAAVQGLLNANAGLETTTIKVTDRGTFESDIKLKDSILAIKTEEQSAKDLSYTAVTTINNRLYIDDNMLLTYNDLNETNGLINIKLNSLQSNLDTVSAAYQLADSNLSSAISSETSRASSKETELASAISAETSRASAAEEANTALISNFLYIGDTQPTNAAVKLWVDTSVSTNGVIKYQDAESSAWIAVNAVWG